MFGECTVKGRALLWSLAFFHNMIDVTGLAPHIIYKEHNPRFRTKDQWRKLRKNLAQRAMYAFDWSLHYQPDCHEKPCPSRCSRNGAWMTDCVTTKSSSYLYHALWQSWIHSDRWTLLFLQRPELKTMEDKKKLCCLHAACLQRISVSKTTCIICENDWKLKRRIGKLWWCAYSCIAINEHS